MLRLVFFLTSLPVFSLSARPGYEKNINRAKAYLVKNAQKLDERTVRSLSLLSRFYVLDAMLLEVLRKAERKFPEEKKVPSELEIRTQKGWRGMSTMARYCQVYPLPWNFLTRLKDLAEPGWGASTRALFVLATVKWKDCERDRNLFDKEMERLAQEVVAVIQGNDPGGELWVESVLALQFSGNGEWIGPEIISLLVAAQEKDGSWSGNTWATTRGLWVLMEMQFGQMKPQNRARLLGRFRSGDNF